MRTTKEALVDAIAEGEYCEPEDHDCGACSCDEIVATLRRAWGLDISEAPEPAPTQAEDPVSGFLTSLGENLMRLGAEERARVLDSGAALLEERKAKAPLDHAKALAVVLGDLLRHCDASPEGETAFERAVIAARLKLSAYERDAAQPKGNPK